MHAAGCFYIQRFCDRDYDSWERMISLNISGTLALIGENISPMKVTQEPETVVSSFVNTEGCRAVFRDEYSRGVMEEFGYGGADTARMLNPGEVADTVWDVVNKPDNVYVEEIMIKDMFRKV